MVRADSEFPGAGNFFSRATILVDSHRNVKVLRGVMGKFPERNREVFQAEQGTFGGWQGMPGDVQG